MKTKPPASPIAAIALLSLGGLMLHLRVHPVSLDPTDPSNPALLVPLAAGILSAVVSPVLLAFPRTFLVGYLWNGMSAVVGSITMAAAGFSPLPSPLSAESILLGSTLSSILLLLPKLFLGQIALRHYHPGGMGRLFTARWWVRHFFYVGAAFALGRLIGR